MLSFLLFIVLLASVWGYNRNDKNDCYNLFRNAVSNSDTMKYCGLNLLQNAIYECCNNNACLSVYNDNHGDTCGMCKAVHHRSNKLIFHFINFIFIIINHLIIIKIKR